MQHTDRRFWKTVFFGMLLLAANLFFAPVAAFANQGPRIVLSKPAARVGGDNIYRWGDTIELLYAFAAKAENFQPLIQLEGCGLYIGEPDPEQRSVALSIPLKLITLPGDLGRIQWVDHDGDGLLRGEAVIRVKVRNENGDVIEYKEIVKQVFWVEHPAKPLPGAIRLSNGPVFGQGDKAKVVITTPPDDWKISSDNAEPQYYLVFMRLSLMLPGDAVTTEKFGKSVKLPQQRRVEIDIETDLPPGPYEIRLMRDNFILDAVPIVVKPQLPTITFKQGTVDRDPNIAVFGPGGGGAEIPVTISVSGFPGGEKENEPAIGVQINDGFSEYPHKRFPDGYLDGEWSRAADWTVSTIAPAGKTVSVFIAYPYITSKDSYIDSFAWGAESIEVAQYTVKPDAETAKQPVVDPRWYTFKHQQVFSPGEKFSIKFGDVNDMDQYEIDRLRPFSVVVRKNTSWKSPVGDPVGLNDIEVKRFEVPRENLTLKGTMPDEPGDYRLNVESNDYVVGVHQGIRFEDLNMSSLSSDAAPVEIYESYRDNDSTTDAFEDESEPAIDESEKIEKPVIVKDSFTFSVLGDNPPGFGIEIPGDDKVLAETNVVVKVRLPQRRLSRPLGLRILQMAGVSSSGIVFGKNHIKDILLWRPPNIAGYRYTHGQGKEFPDAQQEVKIGLLTVPGDYEARIFMPPDYEDLGFVPTTTVLRHRFKVVAPTSIKINEMNFNEKQNQLEAAVDIPPHLYAIESRLSMIIVRPPRLTLNGAVYVSSLGQEPPKFDTVASYEVKTINFKKYLSRLGGSFEVQLIYKSSRFLGESPNVILDRKWFDRPNYKRLPPRELLARAPKDTGIDRPERRFPDLMPVDGPLVAIDEKPDSNVAPAELKTYEAPPTLTLARGYYPADASEADKLYLGFRLINSSHKPAKGVTLKVRLFDEYSGQSPADWKVSSDEFEPDEDDAFGCYVESLDPNEAIDFILAGPPPSGSLLWTAQWDAETEFIGERMATGRFHVGKRTKILDIITLEDQRAFRDYIYLCPYPFGRPDDGLISTVEWQPKTRRLFVVGKNIQQDASKLRWNSFTSDERAVSYSLMAMPDTENVFWREYYERAWLRFTGGQASSAGDSGLEGILVRADLREGVLPGKKRLRVNGGEGSWDLRFGGLTGKIMFARDTGSGRLEPIDTAYLPETIRIAVTTGVQLPISEILVDLHTSKEGFGKRQTRTLTARLALQLGEGVYITGPIGLSEKNKPALTPPQTGEYDEMMFDIIGGELTDAVALAEVNAQFAEMTFAISINPPQARLSLFRTPANEEINYLWKEALKRAAVCNKIEIDDWEKLNAKQVDNIWNIIVFTKKDHYLSEKVKLGHQAAMILLRDMFQVMTKKEIEMLKNIQADDRAVRGFLKYISEFWLDKDFPVNRMKVTGPDGEETTFSVAAFDNDEYQAKEFSTPEKTFTADEIAAWRIRATKQALQKLQKAAAESIKMAGEAGDCEIEDLLKITGFGFDAISRKLTSKLMKLKEVKTATGAKRLYWIPDQQARDWVASVADLAAAVKKQQDFSSQDTDLILAAAAVITMPLVLSESAVVALVVFSIDLLDLAVTSFKEISQYTASQWEQEFSEGASITIGYERNKRAIEEAKGWASVAFAIGTSAIGAGGGVLEAMDALPKLALARRVAKGRKLARSLGAGDLGKLNEPDLEDFLTFAIDSKAKALAGGIDLLSDTQRRAIGIIDTAAAKRKAAASASNAAKTPAAHSPDVVRLEVDPGSGTARMPTDGKIRLKKPKPSKKVVRGPPKAETPPVGVTKTNIKIDQSSPDFDSSVLAAKAGTEVTDPRPFGMMQEAMRHFQETIDRFMLKVRVRAANTSSLKWMHKGHPPKHVKLKSKTINDLDVELGAKSGSQGMVGYFKPKEPANYKQLSQLPEPPKIVGRYKQRLKEYWDNWKDMERLKQKGLVKVEDGVVIDTGLSSKRLNPKTGELEYFRGPKEGTGEGFTGDYDMWDITHPDGSRIITDPGHPKFDADALKRKESLMDELANGPAQTQHGPHKDWIPKGDRDIGIDARIRDSHRGERLPDGSIGPLAKTETRSQSEALLEFTPGKQPRVSYEYDYPEVIDDLSKTDSASRLVSFTDVDGQVKYIPIGDRLGQPGSTSVAYIHADYPDTRVVRVTTEKPGHPATRLDDFGRKALENDIVSDHIRAAKEFDRWDISDEHGTFTRVTVVERVVPIKVAMKETGDMMTKAQQTAFENALRDMNRQGYAWLDNKWDNFGFAKNDNGDLIVVVLDTGGIVKVAGNIETAKRTARSMQLYVNGPIAEFYPPGVRFPAGARIAVRGEEIKEKFLKMVDLEAMGLDDVSQVKFTASSGEQFDYIGPSFLEER